MDRLPHKEGQLVSILAGSWNTHCSLQGKRDNTSSMNPGSILDNSTADKKNSRTFVNISLLVYGRNTFGRGQS